MQTYNFKGFTLFRIVLNCVIAKTSRMNKHIPESQFCLQERNIFLQVWCVKTVVICTFNTVTLPFVNLLPFLTLREATALVECSVCVDTGCAAAVRRLDVMIIPLEKTMCN